MTFEIKSLIDKLNSTCRESLEAAASLCVGQSNYNIEIEHLLLKLTERNDTDIKAIFKNCALDLDVLGSELTKAIEHFKRGNARTPAFSPVLIDLLKNAWIISSLNFQCNRIRSASLLLALLEMESLRMSLVDSLPSLIRAREKINPSEVRQIISSSREEEQSSRTLSDSTKTEAPSASSSKFPALEQFTVNLTQRARDGLIDPIHGRNAEIRQIIDILTRRRQNNPILTGEAGVGKTAVVEGFALKIAEGDVPASLKSVSVRALDIGLLQAGAGVRGEFENRLKGLIKEASASPEPTILFIDEAHTLIGAGGQAGSGDAANLLKPALARGELRTIAATTWSEYKRYFEKDPALARRFQVVKIEEPDEQTAVDMLRVMVSRLEKHHQVRILDDAVLSAVHLSSRYLSGRQLPDKAIGVLDTACARVSIAQQAVPPPLEDARRAYQLRQGELATLRAERMMGHEHDSAIKNLETELKSLSETVELLDSRWHLEKEMVGKIRKRQQELSRMSDSTAQSESDLQGLTSELILWEKQLKTLQQNEPMVTSCVDNSIVSSVISGWTGIPVGRMLTDEIQSVLKLEQTMSERIIGQPQAIDAICRRIRTSSAKLDDPAKPIGVFLLIGPSGVGKTETALTLAELLFGGEKKLLTVNMSEYQEAHTVSALKGAPPGYVGYGKGGVLTEAVRRSPYSVILLDEVEKAHPDVIELFYQVFDKGTLEDSEGVVVDFKHCLILLTSNLGSELIIEAHENGLDSNPENIAAPHYDFGAESSKPKQKEQKRIEAGRLLEMVRPELLRHFKPAFLARLVPVPYYPLGPEHFQRIARLKLNRIIKRFQENHNAKLSFSFDLVENIARRCTDIDSGARNIDHFLTQTLLPDLSSEALRRMALEEPFKSVHIESDNFGKFRYHFQS